jgi:hypothetical protein
MVPIMIAFKDGSANRDVNEPRVSSGQVEVIIWKDLQSPP